MSWRNKEFKGKKMDSIYVFFFLYVLYEIFLMRGILKSLTSLNQDLL